MINCPSCGQKKLYKFIELSVGSFFTTNSNPYSIWMKVKHFNQISRENIFYGILLRGNTRDWTLQACDFMKDCIPIQINIKREIDER